MTGKTINLNNKKINKCNFSRTKRLFKIDNIDVDKILISKKSFMVKKLFKCLIAYEHHDHIALLCIRLPQMIGYVKCFDSNKTTSFRIGDYNLFKKYTKIWDKVRNLMNIEFDSELVYGDNDKHIETKIKIYEDKVNTNFQGKEVPKENASYHYLSLIMIDSAIRVNNKFYPQTHLEEGKYKIKKNKYNFINDDLESNIESDNESDSD